MRKFSKKICAFVSLFVKSETNRGKKGAVFGPFLVSHEIVRQPLFSMLLLVKHTVKIAFGNASVLGGCLHSIHLGEALGLIMG